MACCKNGGCCFFVPPTIVSSPTPSVNASASALNTSRQAILNDTITPLTNWSLIQLSEGMGNLNGNNSVFTVDIKGVYQISFTVALRFNDPPTMNCGMVGTIRLSPSGLTINNLTQITADSNASSVIVQTSLPLNAGDQIDFLVLTENVDSSNITTDNVFTTTFNITRVALS